MLYLASLLSPFAIIKLMDSTQKNLIKNIESQIERLQAQLNEIEEEKDELDADEYQYHIQFFTNQRNER